MKKYFDVLGVRPSFTVNKTLTFSGTGVHTGLPVNMSIHPNETELVFVRKKNGKSYRIPAHVNYVKDTLRCVCLEHEGVMVMTPEHLLSALKAFHIDCATIELDADEVPIMDGSSLLYCNELENNRKQLAQNSTLMTCVEPFAFSQKQKTLIALPHDSTQISYTLCYPGHPLLDSQFFTLKLSENEYKSQIAPCRTFALYEEIKPLLDQGVIQGGTLKNAVLVKNEETLCEGGLRFPNEMVRHKILDFIGDFSLGQLDIQAHFILIGSGHWSNVEFTKQVINSINKESLHV